MKQKWEYEVVKIEVEGATWLKEGRIDSQRVRHECNQLGAEGWELASAFDNNMGHGQTREALLLFKRPLS